MKAQSTEEIAKEQELARLEQRRRELMPELEEAEAIYRDAREQLITGEISPPSIKQSITDLASKYTVHAALAELIDELDERVEVLQLEPRF